MTALTFTMDALHGSHISLAEAEEIAADHGRQTRTRPATGDTLDPQGNTVATRSENDRFELIRILTWLGC